MSTVKASQIPQLTAQFADKVGVVEHFNDNGGNIKIAVMQIHGLHAYKSFGYGWLQGLGEQYDTAYVIKKGNMYYVLT